MCTTLLTHFWYVQADVAAQHVVAEVRPARVIGQLRIWTLPYNAMQLNISKGGQQRFAILRNISHTSLENNAVRILGSPFNNRVVSGQMLQVDSTHCIFVSS